MSPPDPASTATRVLLIEDDPVFAEIVRVYLRHSSARGIELERVDRLEEGLERLESEGIDVVLLDLKLPDSRGYETFRRLHEVRPSIPIVVLTADEDDRQARKAMGRGAQDYLFKTDLNPGLLARSIRYAVERARAEATLRTSEALYRMTAEEATDMIARHTLEGRYLYVSQACRTLLGYEPAELVGRDPYELFHPADLARIRQTHRTILEGGRVQTITYRIRRQDGSYVWFETKSRHLQGPGGARPVEILTISRDVTERQLAAERLEESERRYRAIVEDQTELVCRFRPDGELVFVNQAFSRFFAAEPATLVGRDLFSLFPEEDRVAVATHLAGLDKDRPIRHREQRLVPGAPPGAARPWAPRTREARTGGDVRWLQWTDRALFNDEGRLSEYQSVGRDTSERRKLEEQLRQSQKMEIIGQLVGGIAHDFNNVLTAVGGYGDLLEHRQRAAGGEVSPEVAALKKIVRGAAALTGQLLAFSRRQVVQREILDLSELVRGVDALLHQLIGEHIELVFELAPGPLLVEADPGQIEQVIVNLAINARDAMPMGGRLSIATRSTALTPDRARELGTVPGPFAILVVADDGCGMDSEVRAKIFEPFFTTKTGRGTGLGLATVHRIVGDLGGRIAVESAPQAGATFEILLPANPVPPPFGEASGVWPAADAWGTERILLVEDDEPVRSVLAAILEGRGYRVLSARNAERALELLASESDDFDLLLTDVVMSGLSGPELACEVRRRSPRTQVLYISGHAEEGAVFESARASDDQLLQKPFSARRLLGKLREILDSPAPALAHGEGNARTSPPLAKRPTGPR